MQFGFYRFEHKFFSRAGNKFHGPSGNFHLSEASNYQTNINKVLHPEDSIRVNLSHDRHELYRDLLAYSNTQTRKNARLAEHFIVSLDKKMSHEHQREAISHFLMVVSFDERIQVAADIHRDDPNNPNCHVILIDRAPNGEPVGHFGRSGTFRREHSPVKGNPTEWLRKQWQDSCNHVLAEHGYDFRIDRRKSLERNLDEVERELSSRREPQIQEAEALNPAPESPQTPLEDVPREAETVEVEANMVITTDGYREPYQKVLAALDHDQKLKHIKKIEHDIGYLKGELDRLKAEAEQYSHVASDRSMKAGINEQMVEKLAGELAPLVKPDGRFKGFHVEWGVDLPLIGKGWKSPARRKAEFYSEQKTLKEQERDKNSREAREARQAEQARTTKAQKLSEIREKRLADFNKIVSTYGDDKTLDAAETILQNSIRAELEGVTPEEVYSDFENGHLTADEAKRTFEMMEKPGYIAMVEAREQDEEEQLNQEP